MSTATAPSTTRRLQHVRSLRESFGDVWATAWASDGRLYVAADDTTGFSESCDSNMAVHVLDGDTWDNITGSTINALSDYGRKGEVGPDGATWKANGMTCIDSVLYLSISRHRYGTSPDWIQDTWDASIIKSEDNGRTWSAQPRLGEAMFAGREFSNPGFVHYGQDGSGGTTGGERYVYAISNDGSWNNGTSLRIGRVERSALPRLDGADWEFVSSIDPAGNVAWMNDAQRSTHILRSPGHVGMSCVQYIPQLSSYVLGEWSYRAPAKLFESDGDLNGWQRFLYETPTILEFFMSRAPWGPWRKFHSEESAQGWYNPVIPLKFVAPDASRCIVFAAGLGGGEYQWYGLNMLELELPTTDQTSALLGPVPSTETAPN